MTPSSSAGSTRRSRCWHRWRCRTSDWRPWIYVANGSGGVSAIRVEIRHDPLEGDTIELLEQLELPLGECPSAISFRDDVYEECIRFTVNGIDMPSAPRPGDCPASDMDPWCL